MASDARRSSTGGAHLPTSDDRTRAECNRVLRNSGVKLWKTPLDGLPVPEYRRGLGGCARGKERDHLIARIALALALSLVLATGLAASVGAWGSTCSASGNKVCIYAHQNYGLPKAGTNGSVEAYAGKFYNSDIPIDNSTSSLSNLYSAKDISWYHNPSWGGWNWCVDSWLSIADLGLLDNDAFSSHIVHGGDGAC